MFFCSVLKMVFSPAPDVLDEDVEVEALVGLGEALISAILERAPLEAIKSMIADGAPLWYQDEEGTSPLHAAAYVENEELIRLLIEGGAVWNAGRRSKTTLSASYSRAIRFAVDNTHNTAGDIALSFNNEACYNFVRDAGIRSGRLAGSCLGVRF